jgi:cyclic pyranopterin phosphate synthase
MVDVSGKTATERVAVARALVRMQAATLALVRRNGAKKGDVLTIAQVAGIMAAKRTGELIPLCHPITLTDVQVTLTPQSKPASVSIEATCKTVGPTGVEMEAMAAVAAAALTVYDMCKAIDRGMTIDRIQLIRKSGGRSGTYVRGAARARPASGQASGG